MFQDIPGVNLSLPSFLKFSILGGSCIRQIFLFFCLEPPYHGLLLPLFLLLVLWLITFAVFVGFHLPSIMPENDRGL